MPLNLPPAAWTVLLLTLSVFMPFAVLVMGEPIRINHLYAGLCLLGAVYFIFLAAAARDQKNIGTTDKHR